MCEENVNLLKHSFQNGFFRIIMSVKRSGQIRMLRYEHLSVMFCVHFISCFPWIGTFDIFSTTGDLTGLWILHKGQICALRNVNAVNQNNFSWTDKWHSQLVICKVSCSRLHHLTRYFSGFLLSIQVDAGIGF